MHRPVRLLLVMPFIILLVASPGSSAEPTPPKGFRALFNGENLNGWHGLNPHSAAKLTGEAKQANLAKQRAEFPNHWRVENGELVNDGHGPYATTDEDYGDIELRLEYKTVPKADSGIYLRGTPQVQIWDWNQVFDPKRPTRRPHLGSGGLFNNTPGTLGRDPFSTCGQAIRSVESVSHPSDWGENLGQSEQSSGRPGRCDGKLLGPQSAAPSDGPHHAADARR